MVLTDDMEIRCFIFSSRMDLVDSIEDILDDLFFTRFLFFTGIC